MKKIAIANFLQSNLPKATTQNAKILIGSHVCQQYYNWTDDYQIIS